MTEKIDKSLAADVERMLQNRITGKRANASTVQTSAKPRESKRMNAILLPVDERPKMPLTKTKYAINENANLVAWERETRRFLRNLSPDYEHRVSDAMIFEWATGISVKGAMETPGATVRTDLRRIRKILEYYFGDKFMTWIAGKKVMNCYRVKAGHRINERRPMTMTLWAEWRAGELHNPKTARQAV